MRGGIYSNQRCPICGGRFKSFEPLGIWCPDHPDQRPGRMFVKFGGIVRNIHDYAVSFKYLTGLRFKTDEGSFDRKDYQRDNPLGFANLVIKFLKRKKHLKGVKKYGQRLRFAVTAWGNRNVKDIKFGDIEDLLNTLRDDGLSSKYRYDIVSCLKMFWRWICDRQEIQQSQIPKFPKVKPVMKFRKILTKDQQGRVLDEIYRLTWDFNPRIFIAIQFLATYINCRPKEILNIKEEDIDYDSERILIKDPKEGLPKYLYLIEQDTDLIKSLPKGFPTLPFFRHERGNGGAKPGQKFGPDYLQRWWNNACGNLEIVGVPLYPGTRHSTAVALRSDHSPEAIKRGMGTKSNKAFERYLQVTGDELRGLYRDTRPNTVLIPYPVAKNE